MEDNGVAIQPSFRDSAVFYCCPGVEIETPGYFHESLRDRLLQNFRETPDFRTDVTASSPGRIYEGGQTDSTPSQSGCHPGQSKRRAVNCRYPPSIARVANRSWLAVSHLDCPRLAQRSGLLYPTPLLGLAILESRRNRPGYAP